jgi:iron complex outermembrane receptor protein
MVLSWSRRVAATIVLLPALGLEALAQDSPTLRIFVVDAAGKAVAGASVSLGDGENSRRFSARTADNGRAALEDVPAGFYHLGVEHPGFRPYQSERLDLPARNRELITVVLEGAFRDEVTVVAHSPLVTATGIDVPIADTPLNGGAVGAELIAQQGALTLSAALRNVAGAHARVDYGLYESYTFRGTSGDLDNVLLVDGIRQEGNRVSAQLSHVERVEVLRGPASVLYGNDAFGAAVNFVRKKPQAERVHEIAAGAGSWQDLRFEGGTTGAWGSRIQYRLDAGMSGADAWRGTRPRRLNVTPTLSWFPDARSNLVARYTYVRDRFRPDGGRPAALAGDPRLPHDRRLNTPNDFALSRDHNLHVTYSRQLGARSQLENTLALRQFDDEYFGAESYSLAGSRIERSALYFLHDRTPLMNRLTWSAAARLGVPHRLLAGYDYQRYRSDTDRSAFVPVTGLELPGLADLEPARDRLPVARFIRFEQDVHAVYVQDHVELGSRVKALAGARFDRYSRWSRTDPVTNGAAALGPVIERELDALTGRAGVVFRATDAYALYGSLSTAFRPNLQVPFDGRVLEPERGRQWELGQRLELFTGRLAANLAAFDLVKRNVTFSRIGNVFDQAGRVESRGFELDVEARPATGTVLSLNYSVTDAKFADFFAGTRDLTGLRPRNVPRHTANLWATKQLGRLSVAFGAQQVGRAYADNGNSVAFGDYTLLDAALAWRRGGLEIRVNVQNLLDADDYFTSAIYDTQLYPGARRSALLSLRLRL